MAHPEFRDGRVITFDVSNADAENIDRHDAVKLVGDRQVAATDTEGEQWLGIAQDEPSDDPLGEMGVAVVLRGARNANVAEQYDPDGTGGADTDVDPADESTLVPSGNSGELRPLEDGDSAADGIDGQLLAAPDGDGMGLVFIR